MLTGNVITQAKSTFKKNNYVACGAQVPRRASKSSYLFYICIHLKDSRIIHFSGTEAKKARSGREAVLESVLTTCLMPLACLAQ